VAEWMLWGGIEGDERGKEEFSEGVGDLRRLVAVPVRPFPVGVTGVLSGVSGFHCRAR
jgi:hypothetical protein